MTDQDKVNKKDDSSIPNDPKSYHFGIKFILTTTIAIFGLFILFWQWGYQYASDPVDGLKHEINRLRFENNQMRADLGQNNRSLIELLELRPDIPLSDQVKILTGRFPGDYIEPAKGSFDKDYRPNRDGKFDILNTIMAQVVFNVKEQKWVTQIILYNGTSKTLVTDEMVAFAKNLPHPKGPPVERSKWKVNYVLYLRYEGHNLKI